MAKIINNDSVYSCLFFFVSGLHFFHLLFGLLLLSLLFWSCSFPYHFLFINFIILSFISEFGGGTGWTLYPPLSTSFLSLSPSSTGNLIFGLLISGISSCLTSLNFWTTIINLRSYYLTLKTMPLFLWSLLITGGMLLVEGGNNLILKQLFLDFLSSAVPFCPRNHDCEARSRDGRLTVYSRIII